MLIVLILVFSIQIFLVASQPLQCFNALSTIDANYGMLNLEVDGGVASVDCSLLDRM